LSIKPNIIRLDKVESTNNFAKEIINSKIIDDWTVIVANEQTNGRGQRDNNWISNPNENLTFSVIISPSIKVDKQFYISKIISLALLNFVSKYTEKASIKWPNDIYIDNKKIAGILIENVIQANKINKSIIGIGININQTIFDSKVPNPISLKQITTEFTSSAELNKTYNLNEVLNLIIDEIYTMYKSINNYNLIDDIYNKNLFRLNKKTKFKDENNNLFFATILNTDEFGRIELKTDTETKFFDFSEIKMILE
jgi:BirA family biotin operon repressor/biotin-[acetyl-CoA-carboxylase] ligase